MPDRARLFAMSQPTLAAERLILRPFAAADAPDVTRYLSDAVVARNTLTVPHPYPDGAADEFIARQAPDWAAGRRAVWAITQRDGGALVGAVGLHFALVHHKAEVGYWIAAPAWGRGIATEAVRRVIAFGFDDLGLYRLDAQHYVENPASGRVMAKAGMRREGLMRGVVFRDGVPRDNELYAILRTDPRP